MDLGAEVPGELEAYSDMLTDGFKLREKKFFFDVMRGLLRGGGTGDVRLVGARFLNIPVCGALGKVGGLGGRPFPRRPVLHFLACLLGKLRECLFVELCIVACHVFTLNARSLRTQAFSYLDSSAAHP